MKIPFKFLSCLLAAILPVMCLAGCQGAGHVTPGQSETGQGETRLSETEQPEMSQHGAEPSGTGQVSCLAKPEYPAKNYKSDEERWEAKRELRLSDDFRSNYQRFAYETAVRIMREESGNGLYSPAGLFFSLSLSAAGAEGKTQEELLDLLGYESAQELAGECRKAYQSFYQDESDYHFQIASSLWAGNGVTLKEPFLETGKNDFFAEVYQADFGDEGTGKAMGQWVQEHTNGTISPEIRTTGQTVLALLNTVYYYDEWLDQFDEERTQEGTFTCRDGSQVTCDYMHRTMGSHSYIRGENYTVSSLSTKNGSVQFLLPDRGVDLMEFLETPEKLEAALQGEGKSGEVVWQVPKFTYASTYKEELMDALKALGVEAAFSPGDADFSGIMDGEAWIDSISQQTHVGIDENGIEASAFTMIALAGAAMPDGRAEMILDRPFLYIIRNSGCPIFIGVYQNPAE